MTRSICINLSRAEAKAWAAGAPCLIRPAVAIERAARRYRPHVPRAEAPKWQAGDALIGRECYRTFPSHRDFAGEMMEPLTEFRADTDRESGEQWMSPATMPAALARHRMRVVSVRVDRTARVTDDEWAAAGIVNYDDAFSPSGYVSVTMLEPAPGKEGS